MSSLITWVADHLLARHRQRVQVHLRVHTAMLQTTPPVACHFLNLWNASPERRVQVTHVWIEPSGGGHVSVQTRPLPATVEPQHQWETYVPVSAVPPGTDVEHSARVKLASGDVIESVPRGDDVPPAGAIPR